MHAHGGLLVVLLALVLGAFVGNVVVALGAVQWNSERLARLPAPQLSRLSWTGLLLPGVFSLLFACVVIAIPTAALALPALDHCFAHPGAPHLCFVHGTLAFSSGWEAVFACVIGALAGVSVASELLRLRQARRAAEILFEVHPRRAYSETNDDTPYAFSIGILFPHIVVSRALRRLVTPTQFRAAVAHEVAHVRARDALWRVLARLSSFLLWRPLRQQLFSLLVLAQEKRADQYAARAIGSAALVADALLVLSRHHSRAVSATFVPAVASGWLEARVEALCLPQPSDRLVPRSMFAAVVLAASFMLVPRHIHGGVESLAGLMVSSPVHHHHLTGHVVLDDATHQNPED